MHLRQQLGGMLRYGFVVLLLFCAGPLSSVHQDVAAQAGDAHASRCDAWFETSGMAAERDVINFTLENRSTDRRCVAHMVVITFQPATPRDIVPSAPLGWTSAPILCSGAGVRVMHCGVVWRSPRGLESKRQLAGFGLSKPNSVVMHAWTIEVGETFVGLPYGSVGG